MLFLDEDCILEMAFLLDSSESAKNFNHEQQKNFVLEIVDRMKGLQLTSGRTLSWRIALLQYSSTVLIEQTFRDWKGPDAFKSRIAPITYIGHGTYTTYAITNLTQLYMTEGTHGSVKVAVLLTDGVDHPRNPDIFSATADAKHQGIVFFTVGMTRVAEEVANAAKLRLLASVPASRFVFNLQEKGIVERILNEMVGRDSSGYIKSLPHLQCCILCTSCKSLLYKFYDFTCVVNILVTDAPKTQGPGSKLLISGAFRVVHNTFIQ